MRIAILSAVVLSATASALAQDFAKHVVVSEEGHASDVGRDVLRRGGHAIDAAIATAFALAVTHPEAGNLGGGGFLVAYLADRKEVVTIDFREMAPKAANERMYLGPEGTLLPRHRAGPRAAGVPGTVRGLGLAHQRFGKLPWADLVRPAATLAREGFPISTSLARSLNAQVHGRRDPDRPDDDPDPTLGRLGDFPDSVAAFGKPDDTPWKAGDRLVQRDLAATLDRIADGGPDEFYTGRTADLIAAHMAAHDGLISKADLASYQAKPRPPVHTTFRGHDVYGMGPPASGGIIVALALNVLERYDLKADGPRSPRSLHRITEAMRRAFFIRATAIADPDAVAVPAATLTSKPLADDLARTITDRATPSAALAPFPILPAEGHDTTHLSTIDAQGNAVALTYTLEEAFGSKATVAGAGFLLNNEMGDFNLIPGRTDAAGRIGTPANVIAPHKRMLSSQAPTIVLKDGQVRLVTGSPGGRTIPNTVLWIVLNVLEFGLDPTAAVASPRTHHPWFPDAIHLEGPDWDRSLRDALKAQGHATRTLRRLGDAHTIVVDPTTGRRRGVADPRAETSRASGD